MKTTSKTFRMLLIILVPIFFLSSKAEAQTMTIAPHKIILNAQGNNLDIQTIYGGSLTGTISSFGVYLSFAGTEVAEAYDFDYCYTDNNFIATFDREALIDDPFVRGLANTGLIIARIYGSFTSVDGNGNYHNYTISGKWDYVEILKPGKKK
jgi:hypothetical protein